MAHFLLLLFFWPAPPFWETKEPAQWTETELQDLLRASPWGRFEGAQLHLASARPMREAEEQWRIRHTPKQLGPEDPLAVDEYQLYLQENPGRHIILAVRLPRPDALMNADESNRMETESVLKVGRKKHRMEGHFPPTSNDFYLRMLFPRAVNASVKSFSFELYLPGVDRPYRMVEFFLNEMTYRGKLEF